MPYIPSDTLASHYRASQTLTGNRDDDFAGLTHTLSSMGLLPSGKSNHRRVEGEIGNKANRSQVGGAILIQRTD